MLKFSLTATIKAPDMQGILDQVQRRVMLGVLKATEGNVSETARTLGVTRNGLYKAMDRLEIELETGRY